MNLDQFYAQRNRMNTTQLMNLARQWKREATNFRNLPSIQMEYRLLAIAAEREIQDRLN